MFPGSLPMTCFFRYFLSFCRVQISCVQPSVLFLLPPPPSLPGEISVRICCFPSSVFCFLEKLLRPPTGYSQNHFFFFFFPGQNLTLLTDSPYNILQVIWSACVIHKMDNLELCLLLSQIILWRCSANSLLMAKKWQQLRRLLSCSAFHAALTWNVGFGAAGQRCLVGSCGGLVGRCGTQMSGCESRRSSLFVGVGRVTCCHHCCFCLRCAGSHRRHWSPIWAMQLFALTLICTNLITILFQSTFIRDMTHFCKNRTSCGFWLFTLSESQTGFTLDMKKI